MAIKEPFSTEAGFGSRSEEQQQWLERIATSDVAEVALLRGGLLGRSGSACGLGGRNRQLEGGLLYRLADNALLQAASADANGLIGAGRSGDLDPLQVRAELPAGDARNLRTDAAQVLRLTARFDRVAA